MAWSGATPRAEAGRWQTGPIRGGGYLQHVVFCPSDPQRLYLSTDVGGLYRSDDRGTSWRMLHAGLPAGGGAYDVRGLVVDPTDADRLVIATGSPWDAHRGVFVSVDGGHRWRQTLDARFPGNGEHRAHGRILVAVPGQPQRLYAASHDRGVFHSADFGATWQPTGPLPVPEGAPLREPSELLIDQADPQRLLLAIAGEGERSGLFESRDGGRLWQRLPEAPPSEMQQDPNHPDRIYGIRAQRPVISRDSGRTFQPLEVGLPPTTAGGPRSDGHYQALAVTGTEVLLGAHGGAIYRLDRARTRWEPVPRQRVEEGDWWGRMRPGLYNHFGSAMGFLAVDPADPDHWFFTDWYALYRSPDAGGAWELAIDGIEMTVIHTLVADPFERQHVHVGLADLGYFRSRAGETFDWVQGPISNNIKSISASPVRSGEVYATGPRQWHWHANQVFRSWDGGRTWSRPAMRGLPDMKDARCNTVVADPRQAASVFLAVSGPVAPGQGGIYHSVDGGENWTWGSGGMPPRERFFRRDLWVHGPELAVAADGTVLAASIDTGAIFWSPRWGSDRWLATTPPRGRVHGVFADPHEPGVFYAAMSEGGLWRGRAEEPEAASGPAMQWSMLLDEPVYALAADPQRPGRLAAVTEMDVFWRPGAEAAWQSLGEGLAYRHRRNVAAFAGERLLVGTGGSGVFWRELPR